EPPAAAARNLCLLLGVERHHIAAKVAGMRRTHLRNGRMRQHGVIVVREAVSQHLEYPAPFAAAIGTQPGTTAHDFVDCDHCHQVPPSSISPGPPRSSCSIWLSRLACSCSMSICCRTNGCCHWACNRKPSALPASMVPGPAIWRCTVLAAASAIWLAMC